MGKRPPTPPDGVSPFERAFSGLRSPADVYRSFKEGVSRQSPAPDEVGVRLTPGDIVQFCEAEGKPVSFTIFGIDPAAQQTNQSSPKAIERKLLAEEERRLRGPVAHLLVSIDAGVSFADVVGNEAAVAAIVEAVEEPVTHQALYAAYGMKAPKGILLHGPPGCGKTMLAKAAAGAINRMFKSAGGSASSLLLVKGPEIESMWVGKTEETIRAIFAYARAYRALHRRPLLIFIDEADAILQSRSDGATWFQKSNVATFLAEMDGLQESGALVILATNRPEAIDEALLRDGRCDRKVKVERPTEANARFLLERGFKAVPLAKAETPAALAELGTAQIFDPLRRLATMRTPKGTDFLTLGSIVSGAMIVGLVERAKAIAFRRDRSTGKPSGIGAGDVRTAVDEVFRENGALDHPLAVVEFCQRIEVDSVDVKPIRPRTGVGLPA